MAGCTPSGRVPAQSDDWDIQRAFWAEHAAAYHESHVCMGDEHFQALDQAIAQCRLRGFYTVLDVGTGTGRGTAYLRQHGLDAVGADPVEQFLERAVADSAIPRSALVQASGLNLPFRDDSFDAVCATGVLHHIREPNLAVAEMLRVARHAVFISDSNRFGQGPWVERVIKVALAKLGLWVIFERVRTRGKRYHISEGDGIFYSYSVYDSLALLADWADEVGLVGTDGAVSSAWLQPLLTSPHALAFAFRKTCSVAPE